MAYPLERRLGLVAERQRGHQARRRWGRSFSTVVSQWGWDRPGVTTMALSVPPANSDVLDENGEVTPKRED